MSYKSATYCITLVFVLIACSKHKKSPISNEVNFDNRTVLLSKFDSLPVNGTYLSVYSEIYSYSQDITHNLTATVSMRNTSTTDSLYILEAEYYDTHGKTVKNYVSKPIFIAPMETLHIVIDEDNKDGGSGANFLFKWATNEEKSIPLFEAIMISTSGSQGLSFTTTGKKIF
ncbi:DUF3124 domain-containing protein [Flagellimonas sp. 389]|uniref:DUF3124 domain-containing protein n=1 Tax=Flagellimonas sp. 389 TaxID=2835862 RepID=UPI001BD4FDA3|nr:DUF3124 domain-containing protein [Flagellimonas sp. 389]MBS9463407.1 DUF3124 domain-containing protein [Flagellimonas sp. 389]